MHTQLPAAAVPVARKSIRRAAGFACSATLGMLAIAGTAHAAADAGYGDASGLSGVVSQPAAVAAEAWYRPEATCATPVGCLPVSLPSTYPAGTLHVGVLAGQEESLSFVSLRLPAAPVEGGTLRLPVSAASSDGTLSPDTAKVQACLVTGTVTDKVEGGMGGRPTPDCSVASPAVTSTVGGVTILTVNLAPFRNQWDGESVGSVALVPAAGAAPTDVWHLAFSRHDRTGAGVVPLSATLLVPSEDGTTPSPSGDPVSEPPATTPVGTASGPMLPAVSPPLTGGSVPQIAPSQQVAPPSVSAPTRLLPAALQDTSFAYPGVFLLPPLVLLAVAWVARAFTRDFAEVEL